MSQYYFFKIFMPFSLVSYFIRKSVFKNSFVSQPRNMISHDKLIKRDKLQQTIVVDYHRRCIIWQSRILQNQAINLALNRSRTYIYTWRQANEILPFAVKFKQPPHAASVQRAVDNWCLHSVLYFVPTAHNDVLGKCIEERGIPTG